MIRSLHADTLTSTLPGFIDFTASRFTAGTFTYVLPAGQTITAASLTVTGLTVASTEYSNPTFFLDDVLVSGLFLDFNPIGPYNFTSPLKDFSFLTDGSAVLTVDQYDTPDHGTYSGAVGETLNRHPGC